MFVLTIKGRDSNATKPNITVDPTLVASHVFLALQSIVSCNADPVGQLVVSVTSFENTQRYLTLFHKTCGCAALFEAWQTRFKTWQKRGSADTARETAAAYSAEAEL